MSGKRSKQIRSNAKWRYTYKYSKWYMSKPSRWRIFKYLKWKKAMPKYEDEEKKLKYIAKRR